MKLAAKSFASAFAVLVLVVSIASCEEELTTIGDGVIAGEPFTTGEAEFDVFAYNKRILAAQTNKLPLYQLGFYNDPIYGKTEASITAQLTLPSLQGAPTFGDFSQSTEDIADSDDDDATIQENEVVKEVVLYIPYQLVPSNYSDKDGDGVQQGFDVDDNDADSDSDNDGVSDSDERLVGSDPLDPNETGEEDGFIASNFAKSFALDSVYGDLDQPFRLMVQRSTFYLGDLDPDSNFLDPEQYFSNQEFAPQHVAETLFDDEVTISNKEYLFFFEDDPDTEEDESEVIEERLNPGIRVNLDTDFFQENLINKEGSSDLLSQSNFSNFLRGLHFSIAPNSDIALLLDFTQANITVTYEYDDRVGSDEGGETVYTIESTEREFTLNFLQRNNVGVFGNAVNTIINPNFPESITSQLDTGENASRIYLKGGAGSFAEVKLFSEDDGQSDVIIEQIRANNWIVNEANLEFYVDRETLDGMGVQLGQEPPRLYLYNGETNVPLYNLNTEISDSNTSLGSFLNYDGILEKDVGKGVKYTVKITEYLNDIIVRDSLNVPLNLALTSDINQIGVQEIEHNGDEEIQIPVMSTINPFGTVLFGSNVASENEDKKLKLRLFYTEVD